MDVICERCNTRYEFDEALVSTRGTTVKCTTCGHQFKIYRQGGSAEQDGWTVRTVDGRILRFKAMRQLQSAISNGKVTVEDVLVPHDGTEPRRLGRIEELQTFFTNSDDVTNVRRGSWLPASTVTRSSNTLRPDAAEHATADYATADHATADHATVPRMRRSELAGAMADSRADRDGNPLPVQSGDTKRPPAGHPSEVIIPAAPQVPRIALPQVPNYLDEDGPTHTHKRVATLPPPALPPRTRAGDSEEPQATLPRGNDKSAARRREPGTLPSAVALDDEPTTAHQRIRGTNGFPGLAEAEAQSIRARAERERNEAGGNGSAHMGITRPDPDRAAHRRPNGDAERRADFAAIASTVAVDEREPDDYLPRDRGSADSPERGEAAAATAARSTPPREMMPSEHPPESPVSSAPGSSTPSVARPSMLRRSDDGHPRNSDFPVSRQRAGWLRWGVGLLVLGLLGVGGFALMQKLSQDSGTSATAAAAGDERVNKFLEAGQERLAAGDLEGAKEQYNKASGIDETDPRVATALARVELIRADLAWLHLRLLPSDASQRNTVALQLRRSTDRADKALTTLPSGAADDPEQVAMRMDLLRMQGKPGEARKLAAKLPSGAAEAGRVLAVLDLSEADPTFASIFDRLRTAARSEHKLGRAQAALVYALALAGERDEAEQELSNLRAQNEHHELLPALAAFVKSAPTKPDKPAKDAPSAAPATSNTPDAVPRDFRDALKRAHAARARGDLDGAERLYRVALDADPGNTEAMAGLADVARDRGDSGSAAQRYEDMLKNNPSYIPGLIGLADVKWASGDKAGAAKLYRDVALSAPGSSYATHANAQLKQYAKEQAAPPPPTATATTPPPQPTSAPTATATATETAPPPAPPPPSGGPAPVDTSDLPE